MLVHLHNSKQISLKMNYQAICADAEAVFGSIVQTILKCIFTEINEQEQKVILTTTMSVSNNIQL